MSRKATNSREAQSIDCTSKLVFNYISGWAFPRIFWQCRNVGPVQVWLCFTRTKIGSLAESESAVKMNYKGKESNTLTRKSVIRSNTIDPGEGVRLIKAFLEIREQGRREKLIRLAEDIAKATS
jgi:hypothetical protein